MLRFSKIGEVVVIGTEPKMTAFEIHQDES
jgi:hypothetical protein